MKSKRLLRFYFKADDFERALNNLIMYGACRSADFSKGGDYHFEKVAALVAAKAGLSRLWGYLNGVISQLSERERLVLNRYALMRRGLKSVPDGDRREIKSAVMKFRRHARGIDRFKDGVELVGRYYCII